METKINIDQICTIKVFRKAKYDWITYKPEKKYWFYTIKAKFIDIVGWNIYTLKDIEEINIAGVRLYVENNQVYYKPHVEIYMNNQQHYMKGFNTIDELEYFLQSDNLKHVNWLNL